MMVQDWGGPIRLFAKALGSSALGGLLVKRADLFVNVFMKGGIKRKKLDPPSGNVQAAASHPSIP